MILLVAYAVVAFLAVLISAVAGTLTHVVCRDSASFCVSLVVSAVTAASTTARVRKQFASFELYIGFYSRNVTVD